MTKNCEQCQAVEVFGQTRFCVACRCLRNRPLIVRWGKNNQERIKGYKRKQNAKAITKVAKAKWRASNRDRENQRARERRKANPEKASALARSHYHNRKARGAGQQHRHTFKQILALKQSQGGACANQACNVDLSLGYHVDHIMPVSKGGINDISNVQLLCPRCNLKKSNKSPQEWAEICITLSSQAAAN